MGPEMGSTKVRVKVINPRDERKFAEMELVVDSGAVYTVIDGRKLRGMGVESTEKMEFHFISNEKVIRGVGISGIEVMGRKWLTNVVFGEEADNEVLGVTTLAQLGLQIDPVKQEIRPLPLYLL